MARARQGTMGDQAEAALNPFASSLEPDPFDVLFGQGSFAARTSIRWMSGGPVNRSADWAIKASATLPCR
jgi:hypothetical protein